MITGAAGNLAKAAVEKFAAERYNVIATVSPGKRLGYTTAGNVEIVETDLADEKKVDAMMEAVVQRHRKIDAALLLVGGFAMGSIADTDGAALKKMYAINFETAYYIARRIFLQMKNQGGGRMVLVGARPALQAAAGKNMVAYALSKTLIFKLAELLNAEGAAHNIVVAVIVPSTIDTPENRKSMPNANFADWVAPSTIADVMSFITSESAGALREPVLKVFGNG